MSLLFREIIAQIDDDEKVVAVLEDGKLMEIFVERSTGQRLLGNIYKGRVKNVLPGMRAAFVDIGLERNAFLYVRDALPGIAEKKGKRSIQDVVKEGEEIVVQIAKEPMGTKGARVTTNLTIPGRYVVIMPRADYVAVSRRIEDEQTRARLKDMVSEIKPPGVGVIVRTVAREEDLPVVREELDDLISRWRNIEARSKTARAPCLLYRDVGLLSRILRDLFGPDVSRFVLNSREEYDRVLEELEVIAPQLKSRVALEEDVDLLEKYNVHSQVEYALRPKVWLKSGGYLVIDHAEALTAIDVNTGKYVGTRDLEETVYRINCEAAVEIARQLRLRDVGGIIIVDFIGMESPAHREKVLRILEDELKKDKVKTSVLGLTRLGLVEITRKKAHQGLEAELQRSCPYCGGTGKILSEETVAIQIRRDIASLSRRTRYPALLVEAHPLVSGYLIGSGGSGLRRLEKRTGKRVIIRGVEDMHLEEYNVNAISDLSSVRDLMAPVKVGQVLDVAVEETHVSNPDNGISRINGFVINIEGAGLLVGQRVPVQIVKVFRTHARARLFGEVGTH